MSRLRSVINNNWFTLVILIIGLSDILGSWSLYSLILLYPILFYKTNIRRFMDSSFWWLVVFSISYTLILLNNTSFAPSTFTYFSLYPPLFYLLGGYFVEKSPNLNSIVTVFLILITAYFFLYFRNAIIDTVNYGLVNPLRSISVNDDAISGAYLSKVRLSLATAGIGFVLVPTKNSAEKRLKLIFILLGLAGLFTTIHYLHRTGLVFVFASLLIVSFKLIKKRSTWLLIFFTGIFVLISANFLVNIPDVQLILEEYQLRETIEGAETSSFGGRIERWSWVFDSIFSHPWGGIDSTQYGFAHNLWLDIARQTGIIPFVTLVIFTLKSMIKAFKLLKLKIMPLFFSCFLLTLNTIFFLQAFIEPILEADPLFFWFLTLFLGMQNYLYKVLIKNKRTKQYAMYSHYG